MYYAFYGCTSLTTVDMSSLTSIGNYGMNYTFYQNTALKTVYLSKLSSVGTSGLNNIFNGCTSLEIVDFSEATAVPTISNVNNFANTNSTYRILVPHALYDSWIAASVWSNESIKPHIEKAGLMFKANTPNSTIGIIAVGNAPSISLEYSTDGTTYSAYTVGTTITLANVDDTVVFRAGSAGNTGMASNTSDYNKFVMTGSISADGSAFYLLDKYGTVPATMPSYCFYGLFKDCSALTTAPTLPSTTLGSNCYGRMFSGCTSLTTAPSLPATTVSTYCYSEMFKGCSSLTAPPYLPATTLADGCYDSMFEGCTSLTTAILPASTLATYCYHAMFYNCSSLNKITLIYTGNFDSKFSSWVYGVAASGTLYYGGSDTTTGDSAIPTGWTVVVPSYEGFTLTAREAGSTVKLEQKKYGNSSSGSYPTVSLDYSTDNGITWQSYTIGDTITLANIGDKVSFRATTTNGAFCTHVV